MAAGWKKLVLTGDAVLEVEGHPTLDLTGDVTIAAGKSLSVDTINEKTADAGVTIEGIKALDSLFDLPVLGGAPSAPAASKLRFFAMEAALKDWLYIKRSDGDLQRMPLVEDLGEFLVETGGPTTLYMAEVADGQYLKRSGAQIVGAAGGGGGGGSSIADTDADTEVHTEKNADEDKVRMKVAGTERFLLQNTTPHLTLTGQVKVVEANPNESTGICVEHSGTGSGFCWGIRIAPLSPFTLTSGSQYTGLQGLAALTIAVDSVGTKVWGLDFSAFVTGGAGATNIELTGCWVRPGALSWQGMIAVLRGVYTAPYVLSGNANSITLAVGADIDNWGSSKVVTAMGLRIADQAGAGTNYVIEAGPTIPYLRLVGGAAPGAGLTNLYLSHAGTLRRMQTKSLAANWLADGGPLAITYATGTVYVSPYDTTLNAAITARQLIVPVACVITNLYAYCATNTLNGTVVLTLMLNGNPQALTVTITAESTATFSDTAHPITVAAGDKVSIRIAENASSGSASLHWSVWVQQVATDYPCVLV